MRMPLSSYLLSARLLLCIVNLCKSHLLTFFLLLFILFCLWKCFIQQNGLTVLTIGQDVVSPEINRSHQIRRRQHFSPLLFNTTEVQKHFTSLRLLQSSLDIFCGIVGLRKTNSRGGTLLYF